MDTRIDRAAARPSPGDYHEARREAAERAGISRQMLPRLLRRHGIEGA